MARQRKIARIYKITNADASGYTMVNPPSMRKVRARRNGGMGVTAIMGVTNGRGSKSKYVASRALNAQFRSNLKAPKARASAPAKYKAEGATKRSHYAYPQGFNYPIHGRNKALTKRLVLNALSRYGTHKGRYSKAVQATIEKKLAKASKKAGISSPKALEYQVKYGLAKKEGSQMERRKRTHKKSIVKIYRVGPSRVRARANKRGGPRMFQLKHGEFVSAQSTGKKVKLTSLHTTKRKGVKAGLRRPVKAYSFKASGKGKPSVLSIGKGNQARVSRRGKVVFVSTQGRLAGKYTKAVKQSFPSVSLRPNRRRRRGFSVFARRNAGRLFQEAPWSDLPPVVKPLRPSRRRHAAAPKTVAQLQKQIRKVEKAREAIVGNKALREAIAHLKAAGLSASQIRKLVPVPKPKKAKKVTKKAKVAKKATRKAATKKVAKKATRKAATKKVAKKATRKAATKKKAATRKLSRFFHRPRRLYVTTKRRHSFSMAANRRFRRNGMQSFKALVKPALALLGGFAVHSVVTKFASEQLGKSVPSVSKYQRSLTGLVVALGGFLATSKFMPAVSKEVGLGMFTSAITGIVKELAPEVGKTFGLGSDASLLPRYTLGSYYQAAAASPYYQAAAASPYYQAAAASPYLQAAAATPYLQAAAGVGTDGIGEYFSRDITAVGTGEYFARNIQVHGYGDYEISSNYAGTGAIPVDEGVLPNANMTQTFNWMEAAAGLGTSPNTADTWIPSENAQAIGSGTEEGGGVFGAKDGIFG